MDHISQAARATTQDQQATTSRRSKSGARPISSLQETLGFGRGTLDKTFGTFEITAQPDAYRSALAFIHNRRSLVLRGDNGTGKTHLALAIGHQLLQRYGVASAPVYFIVFDDMLAQLRATYQDGWEGMGEDWYISRWRSVPVLILDEVGPTGRNNPSDFTRRVGYAVIDGRYRRDQGRIVLTTNQSVEELGRWITEAAVDRLFEMADWVEVKGESWRVHPQISSTTRTG